MTGGWNDLSGRRAMVSGGTKGVGTAVVAALLVAGASVATAARTAPDALPDGVRCMVADLVSAEGSGAFADFVLCELGGVDILINVLDGANAPGGGYGRFPTRSERWKSSAP